jgi:hypothetical protein
MKTRMQPIGNAWQKMPRIVRDLSAELGKDIELEMHGADTELDKLLVEALDEPLIHLVRNAIDHGLEAPEARPFLPAAPVAAADLAALRRSMPRTLRDAAPAVYLYWPERLEVIDVRFCGLPRLPEGPEAALDRVHLCAPGELAGQSFALGSLAPGASVGARP